MIETNHLISSLKICLKQRGFKYIDVAKHLKISEASIKRLLKEESISIKRLGQICELMDLDIKQLVEHAEGKNRELHQLSAAQEQALADNEKLLMVFYLLLNDWTIKNILLEYGLDKHHLTRMLAELDRLQLISLEPGNRVRLKASRAVRWQANGPIRKYFETYVLPEFLSGSFTEPGEHYQFIPALLTEKSIQRIEHALGRLAGDINEIIRAEGIATSSYRSGLSVMLALRRWRYSKFQPNVTGQVASST